MERPWGEPGKAGCRAMQARASLFFVLGIAVARLIEVRARFEGVIGFGCDESLDTVISTR